MYVKQTLFYFTILNSEFSYEVLFLLTTAEAINYLEMALRN